MSTTEEAWNIHLDNELVALNHQLHLLTGPYISATYRCITCTTLASTHTNGDVKFCKKPRDRDEIYASDLQTQVQSVKEHIEFLKEAQKNKEEIVRFQTAGESYREINRELMDKIGEEQEKRQRGDIRWHEASAHLRQLGGNLMRYTDRPSKEGWTRLSAQLVDIIEYVERAGSPAGVGFPPPDPNLRSRLEALSPTSREVGNLTAAGFPQLGGARARTTEPSGPEARV